MTNRVLATLGLGLALLPLTACDVLPALQEELARSRDAAAEGAEAAGTTYASSDGDGAFAAFSASTHDELIDRI